MLQATRHADVVIGSRLVDGGGETGRSGVRKLITHLANFYIRAILGLHVRDCTSGYRVFRRRILEGIEWSRVRATGPAIVQEVLVASRALGARIIEVPILFEERRAGNSTFNSKIMLAGLLAQVGLRLRPAPVRTL
jgi:dolichol-phosphate mannosyltransferase